jgi:hypothetical protein
MIVITVRSLYHQLNVAKANNDQLNAEVAAAAAENQRINNLFEESMAAREEWRKVCDGHALTVPLPKHLATNVGVNTDAHVPRLPAHAMHGHRKTPPSSARGNNKDHESARHGSARKESARCDSSRNDSARTDSARHNSARKDSARQDSAHNDSARYDPVRRETSLDQQGPADTWTRLSKPLVQRNKHIPDTRPPFAPPSPHRAESPPRPRSRSPSPARSTSSTYMCGQNQADPHAISRDGENAGRTTPTFIDSPSKLLATINPPVDGDISIDAGGPRLVHGGISSKASVNKTNTSQDSGVSQQKGQTDDANSSRFSDYMFDDSFSNVSNVDKPHGAVSKVKAINNTTITMDDFLRTSDVPSQKFY